LGGEPGFFLDVLPLEKLLGRGGRAAPPLPLPLEVEMDGSLTSFSQKALFPRGPFSGQMTSHRRVDPFFPPFSNQINLARCQRTDLAPLFFSARLHSLQTHGKCAARCLFFPPLLGRSWTAESALVPTFRWFSPPFLSSKQEYTRYVSFCGRRRPKKRGDARSFSLLFPPLPFLDMLKSTADRFLFPRARSSSRKCSSLSPAVAFFSPSLLPPDRQSLTPADLSPLLPLGVLFFTRFA